MAATSYDLATFSTLLRLGASEMTEFQTFINNIVSGGTESFLTINLGDASTTGTIAGQMSNGASAVAVTITSPTYSTSGAKLLSLKNNTTEKFYVDKDGKAVASAGVNGTVGTFSTNVVTPAVTSVGATYLGLSGNYADGASAVGVVVDNTVTLANAGSKLLSVRNNTVEKAYIKYDGTLSALNVSGTNTGDVTLASVGSTPAAAGASLSGQVLTLQPADGTNGGVVSTAAQTIAGAKTFTSGILAPSLTVNTAATLTLTGNVADSGSNNAVVIDNTTALTGSTRLVSLKNAGVEKLVVLQNGTVQTSTVQLTTGINSNAYYTNTATTMDVRSTVANGGSAVGVQVGTINTMSTSGAKLVSFINNSTEKAFVGYDGNIETTVVGSGFILKSPDGTRYRITVANGGALSTTAA